MFGDELDWGHHWHHVNKAFFRFWTTDQYLIERLQRRNSEAEALFEGNCERLQKSDDREDDVFWQRRYINPKLFLFEAKRQMLLRCLDRVGTQRDDVLCRLVGTAAGLLKKSAVLQPSSWVCPQASMHVIPEFKRV